MLRFLKIRSGIFINNHTLFVLFLLEKKRKEEKKK